MLKIQLPDSKNRMYHYTLPNIAKGKFCEIFSQKLLDFQEVDVTIFEDMNVVPEPNKDNFRKTKVGQAF